MFQRTEWAAADLEQAGRDFFGSTVRIEPRALQAMLTLRSKTRRIDKGYTTKKRYRKVSYLVAAGHGEVFASLRSSLPALSTALFELGHDSGFIRNLCSAAIPLDTTLHPLWEIDWNGLFVRCFATRDHAGRAVLSQAGAQVRRSGYLAAVNLLEGILTADSSIPLDWAPSQPSDRARPREPNSLAQRLTSNVERSTGRTWSSAHDAMIATIRELVEQLTSLDSNYGDQQLALWNDGSRVRVLPFGTLGSFGVEGPRGLVVPSRANVVQRGGLFSEDSLEEFEDLINSHVGEKYFQTFFERHQEYLTMLGPYGSVHSHLVLSSEDGKLIPDFFLEKLGSKSVDIVDIKLPSAEVVRNQRYRVRFRDAIDEAVAQLALYRDYFDDRSNREEFERKYGLAGYRPSAYVIIGRSRSYDSDFQRARLESGLPAWLKLVTYDDLYIRAEYWRRTSLKR